MEGLGARGSVYMLTSYSSRESPSQSPYSRDRLHKWTMARPYVTKHCDRTLGRKQSGKTNHNLCDNRPRIRMMSMSASFFPIPNHSFLSSNSGPTRESHICSPTNHRDAPLLVRPHFRVPGKHLKHPFVHHKAFPLPSCLWVPPCQMHMNNGWLSCNLWINSLFVLIWVTLVYFLMSKKESSHKLNIHMKPTPKSGGRVTPQNAPCGSIPSKGNHSDFEHQGSVACFYTFYMNRSIRCKLFCVYWLLLLNVMSVKYGFVVVCSNMFIHTHSYMLVFYSVTLPQLI